MASTIPSLAFHSPTSPTGKRPDALLPPSSPPGTPSQRLLESEPGHVQFATYPQTPEEKTRPLVEEEVELPPGWVPTPLKGWYAILYVSVLVVLAIALEIALHFTNKRNGWKTTGGLGETTGARHYLYTLPPVAVCAVLVALWTWTDIEIKKMQPYVDLARGDAPPQKSLLLDYTRSNNFIAWTRALYNKHWVVSAASTMVIITLVFQPLASALLNVRNTWFTKPNFNVNTIATVGLNQSAEFQDLSIFLTAAGYASASVGYNLHEPPFVSGRYTVTPFQIPDDPKNGTIIANVTAVKTETNCISVPVTMVNHPDGSGWTNTMATQNGCDFVFTVDHTAPNLFGSSTADCHDSTSPEFLPVVFWFFS